MWKILICDDDIEMLAILQQMILEKQNQEVYLVKIFADPEKLLFYLEDEQAFAGIIILDISLQDHNGIEVAGKIRLLVPGCPIIFLSGSDQFFLDVYKVPHIYFLNKPVSHMRLAEALAMGVEKLNCVEQDFFVYKTKREIRKIPFEKVLFAEKDKRKIWIYLDESLDMPCDEDESVNRISYYDSLESLIFKAKDPIHFVQCHKSFAVNLAKVNGLSGMQFILPGNKRIPVSRHFHKEVKDQFLRYVERRL